MAFRIDQHLLQKVFFIFNMLSEYPPAKIINLFNNRIRALKAGNFNFHPLFSQCIWNSLYSEYFIIRIKFKYVFKFNSNDEVLTIQAVPNALAEQWMEVEVPCFECPDPVIEEVYYFRWWVFRKHIKNKEDFLEQMLIYAKSHYRSDEKESD